MRTILALIVASCLIGLGCTQHHVAAKTEHHVTAKTEHRIIVDPITINLNVRVDRKLEQAFAWEDEIEQQIEEKEASN